MNLKRNGLCFYGALFLAGMTAACSRSSQPEAGGPGAGQSPASRALSAPSLPSAAPAVAPGGSNIWRSETTGKEYRVTIKGDELTADWVNLPPLAAQHGSYIHTVCKRKGSKWIGTSSVFMACTVGEGAQEHIANTCHLTMKMEFDRVSKTRITGRGQALVPGKFDCRTCKALETSWGSFTWVPVN